MGLHCVLLRVVFQRARVRGAVLTVWLHGQRTLRVSRQCAEPQEQVSRLSAAHARSSAKRIFLSGSYKSPPPPKKRDTHVYFNPEW